MDRREWKRRKVRGKEWTEERQMEGEMEGRERVGKGYVDIQEVSVRSDKQVLIWIIIACIACRHIGSLHLHVEDTCGHRERFHRSNSERSPHSGHQT